MPEEAVQVLRDEFPQVFHDRPAPNWDAWDLAPVGNPSSFGDSDAEDLVSLDEPSASPDTQGYPEPLYPPELGGGFPGAPHPPTAPLDPTAGYDPQQPTQPGSDVLAFYLPFHYYWPRWWGIYLILEGVDHLANFLAIQSRGVVPITLCREAAKIFLYRHEYFHCQVECFGTKLEVAHREPIYRTGFQAAYRRHAGSDRWLEEALADGYALYQTNQALKDLPTAQRRALRQGLRDFVCAGPKGYRQGVHHSTESTFVKGRSRLAEVYFASSLPTLPGGSPSLWGNFGYGFDAFTNVKSRTKYLVRKGSPLTHRWGLKL